jgi:hypothetical protein
MTITGTVVRAGCAAARLPLDLAEHQILGEERADWPPVMLFDTVQSGIKQLVGSLTRDDDLVQEGRLQRARVAELRKAVALETVAASRREAADADHDARVQADEERRQEIAAAEAEQRRAAREQRDADQQRAEADLEAQRTAAAKADDAARAAAERADRADAAERIKAEKAAVAKKRRAVAAEKKTQRVDNELRTTKASRAAAKRPAP